MKSRQGQPPDPGLHLRRLLCDQGRQVPSWSFIEGWVEEDPMQTVGGGNSCESGGQEGAPQSRSGAFAKLARLGTFSVWEHLRTVVFG